MVSRPGGLKPSTVSKIDVQGDIDGVNLESEATPTATPTPENKRLTNITERSAEGVTTLKKAPFLNDDSIQLRQQQANMYERKTADFNDL